MIDKSLNLARRLTQRNEVDLLQERFTDEDIKYTENFCEALAQKLGARQDIPDECRSYDSVKMILNRREAVRGAAAVAFEGMTPAEAQAAMAAREKGHLNPMQIQRRMTNRNKTRVW
ncbi:hypothetical protein CTEN210_08684 [Chaetoceros tenuissimus]|uniref:Uncharacterized protein n=1 Tax=Chaetoceros tenuissimus TaxID=426638 RepID=A0AAD3CU77_9STRA|nr:hypothetical protein CTEN210_08684 [Chaetoceros tenuissimus]